MEDESGDQFSGLSILEQAAAQMNELFNSLLNSGFSEKQALYLVAHTMISRYSEDDGEY
jgi:hypothetical protein